MAKSTKKHTRAAAADTEAPRAGGDRLLGAVWHKGKMYDHTKAADQVAFKKLLHDEKSAPDKDKAGNPVAKVDVQHLADAGALTGYGSKSKAKAKGRKNQEGEPGVPGELEQPYDPSAPIGGGVEGSEEPPEDEEEE